MYERLDETEEYFELVDAVKSNDLLKIEDELLDVIVGTLFAFASIEQYRKESKRIKTKKESIENSNE